MLNTGLSDLYLLSSHFFHCDHPHFVYREIGSWGCCLFDYVLVMSFCIANCPYLGVLTQKTLIISQFLWAAFLGWLSWVVLAQDLSNEARDQGCCHLMAFLEGIDSKPIHMSAGRPKFLATFA